jgi:dGTPase
MIYLFGYNDTIKGRLVPEVKTPYRNEFQRDKDRIIHSNAFRRLQYKTQVYVNYEGDHYRNRLTHSIEVASLSRSIASELGVSPDLAEAISLAHDIGHTPFGHAGERALNKSMQHFGGFDHNSHALKILTSLEKRYAAFDGLNLTWEVLEGLVKHNGPLNHDISNIIVDYDKKHNLDLARYSSLEAQIAALSDDIAYNGHDLEDAVRANLLSIEDILELDFVNAITKPIINQYPNINSHRLIYEIVRKLNHYFIDDLIHNTKYKLKTNKIYSIEDIRSSKESILSFSRKSSEELYRLKKFLYNKVYTHPDILYLTNQSEQIIALLFDLYVNSIELLPKDWYSDVLLNKAGTHEISNIVVDYIAGMTDRYAIRECEKYCNFKFDGKIL